MKFILTRPCADCPFRTDLVPYLTLDRMREIIGDPDAHGRGYFPAESFSCHKTVDYSDDSGDGRTTERTQHCAGAAIVLVRDRIPNTAMQLAERLLSWDPDSLDQSAPVYASRRACLDAHRSVP